MCVYVYVYVYVYVGVGVGVGGGRGDCITTLDVMNPRIMSPLRVSYTLLCTLCKL